MLRPSSTLALLLAALVFHCTGCCTEEPSLESATAINNRTIEASCGQCQLGLPGTGCDLAILVDGIAYYVDGSGIDDHGDAHGKEGLCNVVRNARATGTIVAGRFNAEMLEILPGPGR